MVTRNSTLRPCDHTGHILEIERRVTAIESHMEDIKGFITGSKTIAGFIRKHSGALVAFGVGAGLFNDEFAKLLVSLLS